MKNDAIDILLDCELFSPLIAVHASESAHQTANKNGFDFAQMLLPYTTVQINIKEPTGQQIQHNLRLDIRDLRRAGFLLSNTVFRFVLQESILTNRKDEGQQSILSSTFYPTFLHWQEPAEHEFLRTYLACIFVVSTADANPLDKLAELEAEQHREQHGQVGNATMAKRISPAYCVPSKWFFPNILKYYVLVHDNSLTGLDTQRSNQFFPAICSRYGHNICHLLHLNSANPANPADEMPDQWTRLINKNERGLQSGIILAKQRIYSTDKSLKHASESQNNLNLSAHPPTQLPPVSSAPSLSQPPESEPQPLLFTTSTVFNPPMMPNSPANFSQHLPTTNLHSPPQNVNPSNLPPILMNQNQSMTYAQIVGDGSNPINNIDDNLEEEGPRIYGKWLSAEDRQRLRQLVEDFVRGALVPFVEKQIAEQSEILMKRGSLAKSTFTSMRKWLQNAATNASTTIGGVPTQQGQLASSGTTISSESAESQSRRLADLAFLFGLYQYSNQIYQSLKKDFANDQAWLYHAGCLEMASISSFFANWQQFAEQISLNPLAKPSILATLRKQYPQRYMDNAIHFYANVCKQPLLALRALMNGVLIQTHLEQFTEAAQQLVRFSIFSELALADLIEAVLLEHAARLFQLANNRKRKTIFYLATAGTRMLKFASQQHEEMSSSSLRHCRQLSRRFYEEVLNSKLLTGKGWAWAEHYLICQYISCI